MKIDLFTAFSGIDPKFITEADKPLAKPRKRGKRTAIAATLAAAALVAAIVPTALLLTERTLPSDPPAVIDPPSETPPSDPPTQTDPPTPSDPPTPGDPPMAGSPMSLHETRTLPSGTEIVYSEHTDHSLTILLKKADASPVYLRLAGSSGSEVYYASTDPRYAGEGTRVDAFTITVNGEKGDFPSAPGEYTIVIDYAPLKEKCRSLGELYTSLGAFFL